jgi:nitric oxide reductase NorD protein
MIFEPEETIGHVWHRLVGDASSYKRHPDAAVTLAEVQGRLPILFRALGGDKGVRIAAAGESASCHRLGLLQRIGTGGERLARPVLDGEILRLPASLDCFPTRADNALLYEWLAAWFAHAGAPPPRPADPLQADIATLRHAAATTAHTLMAWAGLRATHTRLATTLAHLRPRRTRGTWEEWVERAVLALLTEAGHGGDILDPAVSLNSFSAPRTYHPFLPVPLWGELRLAAEGRNSYTSQDSGGPAGQNADTKRRKATWRQKNAARHAEPLVLSRFEALISAAEMVNLDRDVDDDDAEAAKQAADDMDELTIGEHDRRAASALKLDLDLPTEAIEAAPLQAALTYPEWDHRRRTYHPSHCRVIAEPADDEGAEWVADEFALRRIRQVRRVFEALRPRRMVLSAQADGDELDLAALVRARADLRAGNAASDRVYASARNMTRDLVVAVLVDVSLSTESMIENRRVLDVEKEALVALSLGLHACGDEHAVFTFTSRRRNWVNVRTVKDFDEPLGATVLRRIQALKPGHYTRMGAAIRHVTARLSTRPNRHRLLLLLTDGKPNDIDYYEGRYGMEDTRMAIREARRLGLKVFGITVDEHARDYFPYVFGRGAYAIFPHVARLTIALPAIYRQIAA